MGSTIKIGVLPAVLSCLLVAGCDSRIEKKVDVKTFKPYPLKNLRSVIPGIHLADRNGNEVLDPQEIDLLVKALLKVDAIQVSGTAEEALKKLIEIRDLLLASSPWEYTANKIGYHTKNIGETSYNLYQKREEYRRKFLDLRDEEVEKFLTLRDEEVGKLMEKILRVEKK